MDKKILVIYVGVATIPIDEIENFVNLLKGKIVPTTFEGEIIFIPTQDSNTRIECINPKYITDVELINEHEKKIKEINIELDKQLKILKDNDKLS